MSGFTSMTCCYACKQSAVLMPGHAQEWFAGLVERSTFARCSQPSCAQRTPVHCVQVLAAFAAAQLLGQQAVPRLLQAVNANMLPVFLAANMLTGLINLSMDTLSVSDWTARAIVACYMLCLCSAANIAYRTKR